MSLTKTTIPTPSNKEPQFFTKTSLIQFGFGIWASLTEVAVGLAFGFSAVAIPQLHKSDKVIKLTTAESAWIASVLTLFAPIGCVMGGYLLDRFGRRFSLIFCQIPMAAGWLYTGLANSAIHMIVGRIITGIGIGFSIGPTRVYVTEISLPIMRGVLGAIINVALATGVTMQALLGSFLNWKTLCYIGAVYTSTLCVTNCFLPETPYYVLLKQTPEKTRETLKKYRSNDYDIDSEMKHLIQYKHENEIRKLPLKQKFKALFKRSACKPFWIMIPFILISQMSGITIMIFYTVEMLQESKLSVDAYAGNVMMGITRLIFAIIAAFLIYKFKRRPLVLFSFFSLSVVCTVLGVYLLVAESHNVFPLICYVAYIASASLGLYSLMLVIMSELYPLQVRGVLSGITVSLLNLAVFAANTAFPYLKRAVGLACIFFCFGISALIGAIFLYFRLPETKGLTLEAIEKFFSNGKSLVQQSHKSISGSDLPGEERQVQEASVSTVYPVKKADKNK